MTHIHDVKVFQDKIVNATEDINKIQVQLAQKKGELLTLKSGLERIKQQQEREETLVIKGDEMNILRDACYAENPNINNIRNRYMFETKRTISKELLLEKIEKYRTEVLR